MFLIKRPPFDRNGGLFLPFFSIILYPNLRRCIHFFVNPSPNLRRCIHFFVNPSPNLGRCIHFFVNPSPNLGRRIHFFVNPSPNLGRPIHFSMNQYTKSLEIKKNKGPTYWLALCLISKLRFVYLITSFSVLMFPALNSCKV